VAAHDFSEGTQGKATGKHHVESDSLTGPSRGTLTRKEVLVVDISHLNLKATNPIDCSLQEDDQFDGRSDETLIGEASPTLPTITANDPDLLRLQDNAWNALETKQPRTVFRRAAELVRVVVSTLGAIIQKLTWQRLSYELNRAARWEYVTKKGDRVPNRAPKHVLDDMLAHPEPPLPELMRVVQMPVFVASGELLATPGYHAESSIFFAAPADLFHDLEVYQRIERPSSMDVLVAVAALKDPLHGFPFVGRADWAHTLALILLPFVRELIGGPTPLHLIYKPTPGTGGTLLAEVVNLIATGLPLNTMTWGEWEPECQRTLSAALFAGRTYQVLDNVHRLDSAVLASAITCDYWSDRKMGSSEAPSIPVRCGWIATGNNPELSHEITRRTVPIHLDARMEHPEDRQNFRHPDIRQFVKERRAQLVKAAITIVRAWQAAGQPRGTTTLGMFESWAQVMGGILDVADVPGFLGNLNDIRSHLDVYAVNWVEFIGRWAARFGTRPVGVNDLWALIDTPRALNLGLDRAKDVISQKTSFGQLLVNRRDHVIGAYRIVSAGSRQRAKQWQLKLVAEEPSERGEPASEPPRDTFTGINTNSISKLQ
jgi:putative DNA primase/helicase